MKAILRNPKFRLCTIIAIIILPLPVSKASEVHNPDISTDAPVAAQQMPDAEAGSLSLQDAGSLNGRKTITFDNETQFPAGDSVSLISIDGAAKDGGKFYISFAAPNKNWWSTVPPNKPSNPVMTFSGTQAICLRNLPAQPGDVYFTFSEPVHYIAFVLCNMLNQKGDKVVFYTDPDGNNIDQTVEIPGAKWSKQGDLDRGKKIFVGVKSKNGIMRVGFSFQSPNGNSGFNSRWLDDLSFKIAQ